MTKTNRLNAICPYFAMFPLEFPMKMIDDFGGSCILDPFCGRGTTNVAARLNGAFTVGVDSSSVAYSISESKMVSADPDRIVSECANILENKNPEDIPEGEFWTMMYDRKTLKEICAVRESLLDDCSSPERIALRGIVMGALHGPLKIDGSSSYLSNQFPRTFASKPDYSVRFWKSKRLLVPPKISLIDIVKQRAERYYSERLSNPGGFILKEDSTDKATFSKIEALMEGRKFDLVVTSPPYIGMNTYIPDQWIRNWFVGGPPYVDYGCKGQIRARESKFIEDVRKVWANCEEVCENGAIIAVRFGNIGSYDSDPIEVIKKTFDNTSWIDIEVTDAGAPKKGRRQSDTFSANTKGYNEIDVVSVLSS